MTSGFRGSWTRVVTPVFSLTFRILFQVLPPSAVLYSPRSPPGPQSGPWAATYTVSESRGSMTILPICSDALRPTFCQVRPPSTDLYTPSPYPTLRWLLFSPVPTHTTLGFLGSRTTQPIEYDPSLSKTGVQVTPALVVFQTPPEA